MRIWTTSLSYGLYRRTCFVLILTAVLLSGCSTDRAFRPAENYYYINPNTNLRMIGRVAVVELNNDSSYPQASSDITGSLFQALQKKQIFGLTVVSQSDPAWRSLQLETDSTYTLDQMQSIRKSLKCDGVLIGSITEFRAYPHMAIGLRLKLLDLKNGQLLWALEQIWDITDKDTESRIKKYYKSQKSLDTARQHEHLASISPLEFIRFVCFEAAETL